MLFRSLRNRVMSKKNIQKLFAGHLSVGLPVQPTFEYATRFNRLGRS